MEKSEVEGRLVKTYAGLMMDVFEPTTWMFSIYDIAHALSNMPRFAGHTKEFYSVASHSLAVAKLVETQHGARYSEWALEALFHDAAEAYVMDMPAPIKHSMPEYMAIEDHLQKVLFEAFHLRYPYSGVIKEMDILHVNMEMSKNFVFPTATNAEVEQVFLDEFTRLGNIRLNNARQQIQEAQGRIGISH